MAIQDKINDAIGTAGVAAAATTHLKQQKEVNDIAKAKEIGEINIAENELNKEEKLHKQQYAALKLNLESATEANRQEVGDVTVGPNGEERQISLEDKLDLVKAMEKAQSNLDEYVRASKLQSNSFKTRRDQLALRKELLNMKIGGKR